ncbi:MAG: 50S ribosomal protein L9 [Candidatus Acidiferrales bacterium]
MQVILQEDVAKLGDRGQIVEVAAGYARNYLLPRKLALEASPANMKRMEKMRVIFAKKEATEKESAAKQAELLGTISVTLRRKAGENDQLFGSVTSADLAEALAAQGFQVDKRKIALDEPIKLVGEYQVPVRLHREITATLKVAVQREE